MSQNLRAAYLELARLELRKREAERIVQDILPPLHPGQQYIVDEAERFNILACGRRFGKSLLGLNRVIHTALEGHPTAYFAPGYRSLEETWEEATSILRPVAKIQRQQRRIKMHDSGGIIEFWPLDTPDRARGRKYKRIVVDEAAVIRRLKAAWTMALRPTLTDLRGDAWFLSTPKGRNFFWECFQRGQEGEHDWKSWSMPTSANPFIDPTEIESARHDLPERAFLQEYMAEFLVDGGGVFRNVLERACAEPQEQAIEGHSYVIGVDLGRSEDYTVITVIDTTTREVVAIDRFSRIDYTLQRERIRLAIERFNAHAAVVETNSMGWPNIELLINENLPIVPFTTTAQSKKFIIEALSLALERNDLRILNDSTLTGELLAFEATAMPSGMFRYSAPEGQHDDCVMSLAFAWAGCLNSRPMLLSEAAGRY
jgi:hypothetical protein